jgi:hypothetical protein
VKRRDIAEPDPPLQTQINLSYAKTDEQRRRDHAHLMEAQKAFVKSDGGNNRRPAALQHFVDHRAQP